MPWQEFRNENVAVEILNTIPSQFHQLKSSEFEDWSTDDDDDSRMNSESEAPVETIIQVSEKRNQLFKGTTAHNRTFVDRQVNILQVPFYNQLFYILGSLALMDLGSVNITSQNVMTAIASLCTRPIAVSLFKTDYGNEFSTMDNLNCTCEEWCYNFSNVPTSDNEDPPRPYRSPDPTISQEKLLSTLKFSWPKVAIISLCISSFS